MTGMLVISMTAAMTSHGENPLPLTLARPTGTVIRSGSWMITSASGNSFQKVSARKIAQVASAGREIGSTTERRIRRCDAPSICAASNSSFGTVLK